MLVHQPTKSLLLNAPDPFMIRELLPNSRMLPHPDYNIAVNHTLESAKVLRNIGFQAPAPIRFDYQWPGKFRPFDHQLTMAEFLTMHRRAFNLSEMGCVDADTEYLSPTGWRRIADYTEGAVAQYHPATGAVDFVASPEFVKLPCDEMIRIKTKYGLDQLLSPEHRVLIRSKSNSDCQEVLSAEALLRRHDEWLDGANMGRGHGVAYSKSAIPAVFSVPGGPGINLSDAELRLQIAVIADGHFPSKTTRCVIRVKKIRKIERLRMLLSDAGIEYTETRPEYESARGFSVFRFHAPWNCKKFDDRFWSATNRQLEVVRDEVLSWDGHYRKSGGGLFSSTSKQSSDFVQYAFCAGGDIARLTVDDREDRSPLYNVHIRRGSADSAIMLCSLTSEGERRPVMGREPSTDGFKYCFMVPSTFLVFRRNGCIFASGNTAKTNASLWAADWLMSTGRVDKALVLSPLSTLERVWQSDIFDTLMHRRAAIAHGSRDKRKAAFSRDVDFYIMNHDGLGIGEMVDLIYKRTDINLLIVDEASMFRNSSTRKYKALAKLCARQDMRIWLMTGTPCPNDPTDAWALAKLICPERVPKFYGAFRRETMMQVSQFKWVPRADAYNTAYEAMQPAVRFRKADCLDLPPVTTQDRQVDLTKEQRQMVEQLKATMVAEAKTGQITAVNAADKINKMRQILCGAVKDTETDEYLTIPHEPRAQVLLDTIAEASAKVLVVCPFKGVIAPLVKTIAKHYSVDVLNGDVTPHARNRIIKQFKEEADPRVLLCHPKVMSHGLNMTEADMLIFYAPIYSNDEFQQVSDRFNRAGQTRKMTIVRMGGHPIEWEIYKLLDSRRAGQNSILDLYKSVTE